MKKVVLLLVVLLLLSVLSGCGQEGTYSFEVKNNHEQKVVGIYIKGTEEQQEGVPAPPTVSPDEMYGDAIWDEAIEPGKTQTINYDLKENSEKYTVFLQFEDGSGSGTQLEKADLKAGVTWEIGSMDTYDLMVTSNDNMDPAKASFDIQNESDRTVLGAYVGEQQEVLDRSENLKNLLEGAEIKSGESKTVEHVYDSDSNIGMYYVGIDLGEEGPIWRNFPLTKEQAMFGGIITIKKRVMANPTWKTND